MSVIGRIFIGRTYSGFSTNYKTPLSLWGSCKQRLIGKGTMTVSVNQKLGGFIALIHARFHELGEKGRKRHCHRREGCPSEANLPSAPAFESFEYYLTTDRELKRSSILSTLSTLQTIVRMAVRRKEF